MESFKDLRDFPTIRDDNDEQKFTDLLKHIYHRHRHVVPVMAMGVAELKKELQEGVGLLEMPEIHQFLDGFYLSRIGIRILIGQHISLHEPEKENYIGTSCLELHDTLQNVPLHYLQCKNTQPTLLHRFGSACQSGRIAYTLMLTAVSQNVDVRDAFLVFGGAPVPTGVFMPVMQA